MTASISLVSFHQWSVITFSLIILSSEGQAWLHSDKTFFFWIVDGAPNRKEI
jgi:hypothetical protein